MSRTIVSVFVVCLLLGLGVEAATAQCIPPTTRTWVALKDNGTSRDTLWFGYHPSATCGLDPALCEIVLPPPPPEGVFDVRFVIACWEALGTPAGMGAGFKQDYRAPVSAARDTHRVRLQAGDAGYPFTLRWSPAGVSAICDSAVIHDEFGGILVRANMVNIDSVRVTNAAIRTLLIIRFQGTVSVQPIGSEIPATFGLQQNYPNPFNPATIIRYEVPREAHVSISLFNLLGQKVAVLVDETMSAGFHRVTVDATSFASGGYFYRMRATALGTAERYESVLKLIVLK